MENFYHASKDEPMYILLSGLLKTGKTQGGIIARSEIDVNKTELKEGRGLIYQYLIPEWIKEAYGNDPKKVPRWAYTTGAQVLYNTEKLTGQSGAYAGLVIEKLMKNPKKSVTIFSNLRRLEDVKRFSEQLGNVMILGFYADKETIIDRILTSGDELDIAEINSRKNTTGDDAKEISEDEKRGIAEKIYSLEIEVHNPLRTIDALHNFPNATIIDTSGQKDFKKMRQEISSLASMIKFS